MRYGGVDGSVIRYDCRTALFRDGPGNQCISFGALRVETAVVEELLRVLEPDGLRAALEAAETLASERDDRRHHLELALAQAQFEAGRAKRQYDAVDPENRLVAAELERRWNERLADHRSIEERIAVLDSEPDGRLTAEERERLMTLGCDLEQAWTHPATRPETRKRILRSVLVEVVVGVLDPERIELTLHWRGGDHTRTEVIRSKTGQHRWTTPADVKAVIEALARQTIDRKIAAILNRAGKRTARGHTWSETRVRVFRKDHNIPAYREGERAERGEVTVGEAAAILAVHKMTLLRLIRRGVLPARQLAPGTPWVIQRADLDAETVRRALTPQKERPGTADADQGSLDLSIT